MKKYFFFLLLLIILGCQKNNFDETHSLDLNVSNKIIKKTIQYDEILGVDSNLLSLDIYYLNHSKNSKNPIVIYVHGGVWAIGDKSNKIDDKVNLFLNLNYTFVSINYRLSPSSKDLNENRVKFPIHNQDVAKSIKYIYDNAEKYNSDNSKIILIGHSAGAHLVSLTATNEEFLLNENLSLEMISGVIALDTEGFNISSQIEEKNILYLNAFGTNKTDLIKASPIFNVDSNKNIPPFLITLRGNNQRIESTLKFINVLKENSIFVKVVEVHEYSHEEVNSAVGKENEEILTPEIISFIEAVLK